MRKDVNWLDDILESISQIEKYANISEENFMGNELVQTWMFHHLQIIGEAANRLSSELLKNYPEMKWREIISMRNIIVHEYFGIDAEEIWNTVQHDIPKLKLTIIQMIASLQHNNSN